jgi:hypothetical protein
MNALCADQTAPEGRQRLGRSVRAGNGNHGKIFRAPEVRHALCPLRTTRRIRRPKRFAMSGDKSSHCWGNTKLRAMRSCFGAVLRSCGLLCVVGIARELGVACRTSGAVDFLCVSFYRPLRTGLTSVAPLGLDHLRICRAFDQHDRKRQHRESA